MKPFGGFPPKMQFTAVPEPFFSHLLPQIDDITELKVVLTAIHLLYHKKGYPKFVSFSELLADTALIQGINDAKGDSATTLSDSLVKAVEHGILLSMSVLQGEIKEDIYVLNSDAGRTLFTRITEGGIVLPGIKIKSAGAVSPVLKPDIFSLYESNIGMITPMIAEELKAALKIYPEAWLIDAVKEATNQNKRKWSYISAILERWGSEGKTDGTYRRDTKKTDPDKYIRGKYGHMVQR